jgi:L-2-hydroxyglutarate oxidase
MKPYDITIVGAGLVGLAAAYQLQRLRPGRRVCVIDKEHEVAQHQSGRNSNVIHSGVYYRPGSSRAENCRRGYRYLLDFLAREGLPYDIRGKLIVATRAEERPVLDQLLERGRANGLQGLRKLGAKEARELEPAVAALEALWVPEAGITDYGAVARRLAAIARENGGELRLGERVVGLREQGDSVRVITDKGEVESRLLLNCAGLYSDRVGAMSAANGDLRILPFRGEYYMLREARRSLARHLIYPVPNPHFPFLGVHFTPMIDGNLEAGPNAVLAFAREGYRRRDLRWGELWDTLRYPGFHRLAARHWREGLDELWRSFSKRAFTRALQRLAPELREEDLVPARSGVRAMACDRRGRVLDDFVFHRAGRCVHVLNAPSPAATACLAIGETLARMLET